jgi:predicted ABC-type ATPase
MKVYTILAGVNGAGKSTFYETYPRLKSANLVSSDAVLRDKGLNPQIPSEYRQADTETAKRLYSYINEGVSFVQENILCSAGILDSISAAREKGFRIVMHYIGLESADIAKERIAKRDSIRGFRLPDSEIESRYYWSFIGLREVLPRVDLAAIYDNSRELRRFAIYKNGQLAKIDDNVPLWFKSNI